jgi:lysyl endopeptidase
VASAKNTRVLANNQTLKLGRLAVCSLLATGATALNAAPTVDVVAVNLAPLIERAAESPSRFAVDVPHAASPSTAGQWSRSADVSTWTHAVQIPGAVSMSFHAADALLPASATLTVSADGVDYVYTAKDADGAELWSRIGRGDTLAFELSVATEDEAAVRLEIASLQAGYRALANGMANHGRYDELKPQSLPMEAAATSCAENWVCNVTPANEGPGNATVALIISNIGQCTGVLLNNVPGDGTPYVLTARHCQNGNPDGGSPGAAASVVAYWNALSACGTPLGSIHAPGLVTQRGAQTVVEQQDAWLIRLDRLPLVDAYYAGWDATGGTFVGGFTAHHAAGTSRQFVGWYGQAAYLTMPAASLGVHYDSTLWATVNALGAGGPGASGAGLFDATGRLVGTLVRGRRTIDASGVCPSPTPEVPSESTATSLSTAFAGIFDSTVDPRSTTGAVTLRSVLDPGNTGTRVLAGRKRPITVTLSNHIQTFSTGTRVPLDWSSSPGATSCSASGGESGDGWAGTLATRGSKEVTSFDGGDIVYTVTCTDGERIGVASVTLRWALSPPTVSLDTSHLFPAYGVPFNASWTSNVRPCTASGGNAGDGWGGPLEARGTATITETVIGPVTYTLTCGSGTRTASQQRTVNVAAPMAVVRADAVTLRIGQSVVITTAMRGAPCVQTGGRAGDGWAGSVASSELGTKTITESTPGTFTYGLACGSGAHIATAEATVTFADDPAAVSVRASSSAGVVREDVIAFNWDSNVRPCARRLSGPSGTSHEWDSAPPSGSLETEAYVIGEYVFSVTCGSGADVAHGSTAVRWTGTPSVQINAPSAVMRGELFTVSYTTNVVPCTWSGGSTRADWPGSSNASHRAVQLREDNGGTVTYTMTCGSGAQTASASVNVDVVAVTLTADPKGQLTGQPVTLTWSSSISPCVPSGGRPGDGWTDSYGTAGSVTVTEPAAGAYVFSITCGTGSFTARASADVTYADVAAPVLTASRTRATIGDAIRFTWSSADGSACFASSSSVGWAGDRAPAGTAEVRLATLGRAYYRLRCGQSLEASVAIDAYPLGPLQGQPPPTVHLTPSASSLTLGEPLTLTWTASNAEFCTVAGGQTGGWSGDLATDGSVTLTHASSGTFIHAITCYALGGTRAHASASVVVNQPAPPPTSPPADSGGGGGGAMGALDGAFLLVLGLRLSRRAYKKAAAHARAAASR